MVAKILQVNLNNSAAAMLLMEKTCQDKNIDLVTIQEPNARMARSGRYFTDKDTKAAILVPKNSRAKIYKWGRGDGYAWVSTNGTTFMSCYVSPNCTMQEYERLLDGFKTEARNQRNELIIGGDFNAKSHLWGSKTSDARGEILGEVIAELNLTVLNTGNTPTFRRTNRGQSSVIDVTLATTNIAAKIRNWTVDDEAENLSDHNYIYFEVTNTPTEPSGAHTTRSWRITEEGLQKIGDMARNRKNDADEDNEGGETLTKIIRGMCKKALKRNRTSRGKRPIHWWCEEVSEARKTCVAARRRLQRANGKKNTSETERTHAEGEYKRQRKDLRAEFAKAKTKAWKALLTEVDNDKWGDKC